MYYLENQKNTTIFADMTSIIFFITLFPENV